MDVSLILPIYQAEDFLSQTLASLDPFLTQLPGSNELVLVVDGSPDRSLTICQAFAQTARAYAVRVLDLPTNVGKGGAIQHGMAVAAGRYRVFTDCDLAYPVTEIAKVLARLRHGGDICIGVRGRAASLAVAHAHDPWMVRLRQTLSRVFNWLVTRSVGLRLTDTQSGLKAFTAEAALLLFPRLRTIGFTFDVEILAMAARRGLRISEVPVTCHYRPQSTIKFGLHGLEMLRDLAGIWWRGLRERL